MPSMLRAITANVLRLFIASFLVVPVIITALLVVPKDNERQDSEKSPESEIPLASKIMGKVIIDDQRRSPLFSVLPPEIRNRIFAFACTAYETIPYTPNDWYYRPGYHAHRRISAALLMTCRRIYLETYTLPLEINEHVFWGSVARGPPCRYSGANNYKRTDLNAFFDCLTPHQRVSVQEVHLFAQQFWLEDLDLSSGRVATRKIKLTLRYQDWYFWEVDEPLGICPWLGGRVDADDVEREKDSVPSLPRDLDRYVGWGRQFEFVHGLEELEIEFETLRFLKDIKLDPIVAFAKQWQFPLMRQGVLEWDKSSGAKEYTWTGSKLLGGELDDSTIDLYDNEADNMSDADDEHRPDSPAYDTGSTYEFSDWEDELPSATEQQDAITDITRHAHLPTISQLHDNGHAVEDILDQRSTTSEHSNQLNQFEATADELGMTGSVIYEPPYPVEAEDTSGIEDHWPDSPDMAVNDGQDVQPTVPLLALESNMQGYYVVSLIWRKRKQESDAHITS